MIAILEKEVCKPCSKTINIGQPLLECEICFSAIHTKCHKIAGFNSLNGLWACSTCSENMPPRYNPFPSASSTESYDKFYDDEGAYDDAIIQAITRVLECCKSYTVKEINEII